MELWAQGTGTSPSPVSADNLITGTDVAVHLPQKDGEKSLIPLYLHMLCII